MNKYDRECIRHDTILQLKQSWTWAKLTQDEQNKIGEILEFLPLYANDRHKCWDELDRVYSAFLIGCGYKPTGWRE